MNKKYRLWILLAISLLTVFMPLWYPYLEPQAVIGVEISGVFVLMGGMLFLIWIDERNKKRRHSD